MIHGIFVYLQGHLKKQGGGVQICTREYVHALETAGFKLSCVEIEHDRRFITRISRKLPLSRDVAHIHADTAVQAIRRAYSSAVQYIFINHRDLACLAAPLKSVFPDTPIILLSHGLKSVDTLHALAIGIGDNCLTPGRLGKMLVTEHLENRAIDHVFCLAPFEVEIERWLGARSASHLPRTIPIKPLDWRPDPRRVGFVGRLDHPPNYEGLVLILKEMGKICRENLRLRIVGGPPSVGNTLARQFPFVDYLGELPDDALHTEAATWSVAAHPLFRYAMGCSTKLAVMLAWQIPIVATTMGTRGYSWKEGRLPMADDPESFARRTLDTLNPDEARRVRAEIKKITESSPRIEDIGKLILTSLRI